MMKLCEKVSLHTSILHSITLCQFCSMPSELKN